MNLARILREHPSSLIERFRFEQSVLVYRNAQRKTRNAWKKPSPRFMRDGRQESFVDNLLPLQCQQIAEALG